MSFFEDLGKKITQAGSSAIDKTKQMTEIAKINAKIDDAEKEINELYKQIGMRYFEKYTDNAENDFADDVQKIKDINLKLEDLKIELLAVKGFIKCDNCGNEIKIGSAFCPFCGERAPESPFKMAEEEKGENICPDCGKEVENDAKFCPNCGKALGKDKEIKTTDNEIIEIKSCPKCDATITSDATECPVCGEKLNG